MGLSSGDNPVAGQNNSVTTTAAALATNQPCMAVWVQADPANSQNVLVGDSSNQYCALAAGKSVVIPVSNVNKVYVKSSSGTQTVNFLAIQ